MPAVYVTKFEALATLLQPKDGYAAYHVVLAAAKPPLVPILGTAVRTKTILSGGDTD